ncbi:LacI family DNA-binding transcriptional regulator [Streptomyces canus]|uniref:LacI family DNA-binding transcriptional regulator n=1 Tax=Streptomyces canus TaxID=58343 RepID=UPI002E309EFA|nr:LacI family DNA-binding transcriptional regulator [Streptomyces canus]
MHVTGHTSFGCQTAPSPGRCGPAGIRDVAQAAGVSYPTVSRVGNGRPNGKEETRGRVEAAVRAPGFRRDATAFALVGRVTERSRSSPRTPSSTAARPPRGISRRRPARPGTRTAGGW